MGAPTPRATTDKEGTTVNSTAPKKTSNEKETTSNVENLSETAATLEMSLKNSAELLKRLSSVGQMDQLQQLERTMKESMQLIERLKSASSRQQTPTCNQQVNQAQNSNQEFPTRLRMLNSMPSNLRDLGKP